MECPKTTPDIMSTKCMKPQEFPDIIDIEKCKYLFCLSDTELGQHSKFKDYTPNEKSAYLATVKDVLANYIMNGQEKVLQTYLSSSCHRVYVNGFSLQNMKSHIKNFIMKDGMRDYDMKNCHFVLLLHLYKKHDLPHKRIEKYCLKRDELLVKYNLDKQKVCQLINMDEPYSTGVKFFDRMVGEIQANKDQLIELEKAVIHPNQKKSQKNPKSSTQSNILMYYENLILQRVMNEFESQVSIPMYDGFNSIGECDVGVMNDLSKEFGIEWVEKPLDTSFVMGHVDEDYCRRLLSKKTLIYKSDTINCHQLANEKLAQCLKNYIVYSRGKWFVIQDNKLWKQVDIVRPYISKWLVLGLDNARNQINEWLNNATSEDTRKSFQQLLEQQMKAYGIVDKPSFMTSLTKELTRPLEDDEFEGELDKTRNKMVFKNGVYDISTKKFRRGILSSDKVSKTLQYNYNPSINNEDMESIKKELFKVFCNQEQLDYYLSVIGYALLGTPNLYQHFYCLVGQLAGNCKSTLMEILTEILPEYVMKGNSEVLEKGCQDVHKHMSVFGEYRIIWYEEMDKEKKINIKIFKEMADGGKYTYKELYKQKPRTINMSAKGFLLTNHSPEFNHSDKGGDRKYVHIQFDSQFRPEFQEDDYKRRQFKADLSFKDKMVEKKMAFIHILFDYAHKVFHQGLPKTPDEFLNEKEYITSANEPFKEWFQDATEPSAKGKLAKDEIIQKYKEHTQKTIDCKTLVDKMRQLGYKSYNKKLGVEIQEGETWYNKDSSKTVSGFKMRGCFTGVDFKPDEDEGCLVQMI